MARFRFRSRTRGARPGAAGGAAAADADAAAERLTWGGRIAGLLFGLVFFGMGTLFFALIVREAWTNWQTRSWTAVPCTIVESAVRNDVKAKQPYQPLVRYRFFGAGEERICDRWRLGENGFNDYADAQAVVDRFPVGSTPSAYLDPRNPALAVLEHRRPWMALMVFLPLIFMLVGGATIVAMFRGGGGSAAAAVSRAPVVAISERRNFGRGALIAFFALFFLIGVGVLIPMAILPLMRATSARAWPVVECTIVSSRVREVRGDESVSYRPDILYRYTVDAKEYHSSRYAPDSWSSGQRAGAAEIVRQYRAGRAAICFVNPNNPREAMLTRAFSTRSALLALIPLVFVLVGAGGMFFTWRHDRPRSADTGIPSLSAHAERRPGSATAARAGARRGGGAGAGGGAGGGGAGAGGGAGMGLSSASPALPRHGPMTLKPKVRPWMKVVGLAVFALIWNGIVSIFVVDAYKDWMRGRGDLCTTAFVTPFVLIGLGIVVGLIHAILAMFNPTPEVTIEKSSLALGDTAEVKWRFTGAVHRIHRLRIRVEAREEATYRRGTDTVTDKFIFHRQTIADTTRPMEINIGRGSLGIPPDTMHTLSAPNNKIIWELCLHGEIAGWPDVKMEFLLDVRPYPLSGGRA